MKIVLVNPPQTFFPKSDFAIAGFPLGLMYIASVLDRAGYDVDILNAVLTDATVRIGGDGTKQYGMPWSSIREELKKRKPAVVGITNPFTAQLDNAARVSNIVKEIDPDIPVIVGGPHASVMPKQLLQGNGSYDVVAVGEGEYTFLDLLRYFEGKKDIGEIDGIAYRRNGNIILNPKRNFIMNLDELPFPAYHLVDMEKYLNLGKIWYRGSKAQRKELPMVTSRGCPFNCVFCAIHLHMGKTWRPHSKEYVVRHIDYVVNEYGVQHIHFEDDNLTLSNSRFEGILDMIIKRGIKFTWDTPNGVRADALTPTLIKKMKTAGCIGLTVSAESGDQSILDNIIDKHLRLDDVVKAAKMCKEMNLRLSSYYVIGLPGEKEENIKRTVDFALMLRKKYDVNISIQYATPFYGTRLYNICVEKGYLTQQLTPRALSESPQHWGNSLIKTEDFTPRELKEYTSYAMKMQNRLSFFQCVKNPLVIARELMPYFHYTKMGGIEALAKTLERRIESHIVKGFEVKRLKKEDDKKRAPM